MAEEIAVYKLQEWDMGNGEKKYSQLGSLEAHYYFAKNNGGKVLFTTESDLYQGNVGYVLLTLRMENTAFFLKLLKKEPILNSPKISRIWFPQSGKI